MWAESRFGLYPGGDNEDYIRDSIRRGARFCDRLFGTLRDWDMSFDQQSMGKYRCRGFIRAYG